MKSIIGIFAALIVVCAEIGFLIMIIPGVGGDPLTLVLYSLASAFVMSTLLMAIWHVAAIQHYPLEHRATAQKISRITLGILTCISIALVLLSALF